MDFVASWARIEKAVPKDGPQFSFYDLKNSKMMLFVRRTFTVFVQLTGNIFKMIFYIDLWLRPQKRYVIPPVAPALIRKSSAKSIPRIAWLTNYTNEVTLSIYVNYLFNRFIAASFEFRFCGDNDRIGFIKENFSAEIFDCYSRLQIGAAQADLWRTLVLLKHGGIYLDIDATLTWSPELFLDPDQTELLVRTRNDGLTNYFMATVPNNSIFKVIADRIIENIKDDSITSVYDMTGPTVVNAVLAGMRAHIESYNVICKQGLFTNKDFQYPDSRTHYWATAQGLTSIVKKRVPPEA
ncbi:glycosyltransferase [Nitrobacter sp. NHB1]|uniref:glycosyltransferase family 32 protein n=1 Tax=Nitrobacter sp. NHB1 TaxID=3119830 RepID=UPI003000F6B9